MPVGSRQDRLPHYRRRTNIITRHATTRSPTTHLMAIVYCFFRTSTNS